MHGKRRKRLAHERQRECHLACTRVTFVVGGALPYRDMPAAWCDVCRARHREKGMMGDAEVREWVRCTLGEGLPLPLSSPLRRR
jgi:hypothetical protein